MLANGVKQNYSFVVLPCRAFGSYADISALCVQFVQTKRALNVGSQLKYNSVFDVYVGVMTHA